MDYQLHKNNPFLRQHVLHVGRHELIRQDKVDNGHSIWKSRAVISINDTQPELTQMMNILTYSNSRADLFLLCADDDSMTLEQAKQIQRFVWTHHHENFLVHCYLGVSRSAAVAKWINDYLKLGDEELNDYKGYNKHIYDLLSSLGEVDLTPSHEEATDD